MKWLAIFGILLGISCSFAQEIRVVTNCPGTVDEDNGRITSPNYPRDYNNSEKCHWSLFSQTSNINLTFEHFDTEQCCDFVKVYDYDLHSTSSFYRLSNDTSLGVLSNHYDIWFTSDGSITRPGFSMIYQLVWRNNTENSTVQYDMCFNYRELSSVNRSRYNYNRASSNCDNNLNGWYRFTGDAGSQIANSCVPTRHCGAVAPGWMQGNHPSTNEGVVSRTVCYSGGGSHCCYDRNTILVKNCGYFYVYKLGRTPYCSMRYCGNGTENHKCDVNGKPCLNGGSCVVTADKYRCDCPTGYAGQNCEKRIRVVTNCPGTVDEDNGRITSPNYPRHSGKYERCHWSLFSQTSNINLKFEHFDLDQNYDFVQVADYDLDSILYFHGRLSNDTSLGVLSNHYDIWFRSDISNTRPGFSLIYQLVWRNNTENSTVQYDMCSNYQELSSADRSRYNNTVRWTCETFNGWYRFTGDAGSQIATSCVPTYHCGSYPPGWMQGNHPSPYEGVVSRTVCFSLGGFDCCYYRNTILVKNCGDFYVYKLGRTTSCYFRYCGNGTENHKCGVNGKPCLNGGSCVVTADKYRCACPTGYAGQNCEINTMVSITCKHDYMEIQLKQRFYPKVNWRNLHLIDPQCRAAYSSSDGLYRLRTPLGSCGTNITVHKDTMVFHNNVLRDDSNSSGVISRDSINVLPFHCKYSRRQLVGTSFEPANEEVKGSEGSFGSFTFSMNMYKSSNFAKKYMPYEYPVKVSLNEKVFIQFQVTSSASKDLVVFAENCRATTSNNPNSSPQYPFLINGCPKDNTMIYRYQPQSVQRFTINSFRFVHTRKGLVYLHCELLVCHRNSTSSRCSLGCVGSRRRRSVKDDSSSVYSLSTGPILGEQTGSSKANENTVKGSNGKMQAMSIGLIAMGAILAVVIVAASLVFIRSKRRNISTPPPTVNAYDGPAGLQLDEVENPEKLKL